MADAFMSDQILAGLSRIGAVLRHEIRALSGPESISATQAQILVLLGSRSGEPMRPTSVARQLAITPATVSDAVRALEDKGLLERRPSEDDGRVRELCLSAEGQSAAQRLMQWPDYLLSAVSALDEREQAVFRVALVKIIRGLQRDGHIPVNRMCVSCRFFRPHVYEGGPRPHHCDYVDAPFGDSELRLDCAEFEEADELRQETAWNRFLHPGPLLENPGTGVRSVQRHQKENTP